MLSAIVQEEAKLEVMQRVWQSGRRATALSLFQDDAERELFVLPRQNSCTASLTGGQYKSEQTSCEDYEPDTYEPQEECRTEPRELEQCASDTYTVDAAKLGDLPARYVITPLETHQFPVVGVYIDKRVIPGFKYRVRPLPGPNDGSSRELACLFGERALTLQSIGRGYARRFTFEADDGCLNSNDNYFWSDNRPEGYAFEIEVISEGDKFTLFDANREAQGTLEVVKLEGPQIEIGCAVRKTDVEKRVKVRFVAKVEFYETGVAKAMPVAAVAICSKRKERPVAEITKVINISIRHHRYYLLPGVQKQHRRVTVKGEDVNDVPTKYTMTGLEPYEIPVVGTYVDPRIIPGFHYRVRPNDRKEHLFDGRSLKLVSIGMGYAKRLTFEPDSLVSPDNYLWSDNHPDGLGLEPRAIHTGMRFRIVSDDGQEIGEASVFRTDLPQREESMEKIVTPKGVAIEKYIHIDVMCHIKLTIAAGGFAEENLMRVCGLAVVRKEPRSSAAHVIRVENVGFDSQLKLIFTHSQNELVFLPIH